MKNLWEICNLPGKIAILGHYNKKTQFLESSTKSWKTQAKSQISNRVPSAMARKKSVRSLSEICEKSLIYQVKSHF